MKKKIAIICGGKSPEHEISIRSVKNVIEALDSNRFEPVLIGISKEGTWYHFSDLTAIKKSTFLSDKNKITGHSITNVESNLADRIVFHRGCSPKWSYHQRHQGTVPFSRHRSLITSYGQRLV